MPDSATTRASVAASNPSSAITRSAASSTSSRDFMPRRFGVTAGREAMRTEHIAELELTLQYQRL